MNQLKIAIENKTDKPILFVNGEEINEREIAYLDFQLNNEVVNKSGETKDVIDEIVKQYVVCQEAEELGISLTEDEINQIENVVKSAENIEKQLQEFNMSYDEFFNMYVDSRVKMGLEMKWFANMCEMINNGEISIKNKLFNKKYKQYSESTDISVKKQLLLELIDIYKEYLVSKANIEYIN